MQQAVTIYNGIYTVTSPTGAHRTFRIKTIRKKGKLRGKRVVELLTGPHNESDYEGFAFIDDGGISVWKTQRGKIEPSIFEKYARMLWSMISQGDDSPYIKKGAEMKVARRCLRCNRLLTTPESIELGIGPECAEKMGMEQ